MGKPFILEQGILHPSVKQRALARMSAEYPSWAQQGQVKSKRMVEAELTEHRLASRISVGSEYVRKSFIQEGVAAVKMFINPYGVPEEFLEAGKRRRTVGASVAIRFAFAGYISGRKGIPVLLEAWSQLGHGRATMTIAGATRSWPAESLCGPHIQVTGSLARPELLRLFENFQIKPPIRRTNAEEGVDLPEEPPEQHLFNPTLRCRWFGRKIITLTPTPHLYS